MADEGREPIHVVGAAIVDGGRCLVAQRGAAMALAGKWEFVGGKVEPGEDPRRALAREVAEELGLVVAVGAHLGRGTAETGGRRIVLDVYLARAAGGRLRLAEHAAAAWVSADELAGLDWAAADVPVLPALAAHLRGGGAP
jgi:8-oxo-dGTP diphosphatase